MKTIEIKFPSKLTSSMNDFTKECVKSKKRPPLTGNLAIILKAISPFLLIGVLFSYIYIFNHFFDIFPHFRFSSDMRGMHSLGELALYLVVAGAIWLFIGAIPLFLLAIVGLFFISLFCVSYFIWVDFFLSFIIKPKLTHLVLLQYKDGHFMENQNIYIKTSKLIYLVNKYEPELKNDGFSVKQVVDTSSPNNTQ